jgi:hypothetical protein
VDKDVSFDVIHWKVRTREDQGRGRRRENEENKANFGFDVHFYNWGFREPVPEELRGGPEKWTKMSPST